MFHCFNNTHKIKEVMMDRLINILLFLALVIASPLNLPANDDKGAGLTEKLDFFSSSLRPQKVYLHIDKSSYQAGQTIWFKAYLMDGINHIPDTVKSNLYVDLVDSEGKAMARKILLSQNGIAHGDIELDRSLPEGNYVLMGYTDWMKNFDEDFYYKQHLYISNPDYENIIPRLDVFRNRKFNRQIERMGDNFNIAFFPEGGNLVAGTTNRVAFQVVDELGRGQDAEGEIVSPAGDIVASFQSLSSGIGVFDIEPQGGLSYTARISVNEGRNTTHDFPLAEEGYALRIDNEGENFRINITARVSPQSPIFSEDLIVIGHTRGTPYFESIFRLKDQKIEFDISKQDFPSGIAHLTVFTKGLLPVAERLVFIDHGDELSIAPSISAISENDYIDLSFKVTDHNGTPAEGDFSLSAVSGDPSGGAHTTDMLSYLLLSSDLKGMVTDPLSYLLTGDNSSLSADHLLLTYGWRRFSWKEVLAGELPEIVHSPEPGLTVSGQLIDPARKEFLNNYPVQLKVKSGYDDIFEMNTRKSGVFNFSGLFYEGVVQMELSSRRLPANYPPEFDLDVQPVRVYDYEPGPFTKKRQVTSRGDNWRRNRGASTSPYGSSTSMKKSPQLYGVPDQTIYIDYDNLTDRNLYEVLRRRATGISFEGGQIILRGYSSLMGQNEARFMIDGVFIDRNTFLNTYPSEIERIEIFRGTKAAIFGVRGGTGVILAYTRRPAYRGFADVLEFSVLGFHKPSEFYSDLIRIPGISFDQAAERTVYWEPELSTDKDGVINLRLPVDSGVSRLLFTVEGAGIAGGIGSSQFTIDIENY
jgi:hypothetical protein